MRNRIVLLAILSVFFTSLFAESTQVSSYKLSWKGVEKWYADSSSVRVISFEGAQYPSDNRLPYFNQRITCDAAFTYRAELKNPVYIPLTNEEKVIVSANLNFAVDAEIQTNTLSERGVNSLDVSILPFVSRDGNILKLFSFDLLIIKTSQPQKVSDATRHTYKAASVLSQGKFTKIKISNSGIYKLTYEDLTSMVADPANVRIFGYGGGVLEQSFLLPKNDDLPEAAIWMEKGSDGIFNSGDYILFYAQGVTRWQYDKSKSMFIHLNNPYSQYGYYFVSSDAGTGKKIADKVTVLPVSPTINDVDQFVDYQISEKELKSLAESGKEFYGEAFSDVVSYNYNFNFPNVVLSNTTKVRLDVAVASTEVSAFTLSLNGGQSKQLSVAKKTVGDNYKMAIGASALLAYSPVADVLAFNLAYTKTTSTSVGYLNYLEVNARRQLKMSGSVMTFQNVDYLGKAYYSRFQLSDANANVQIWDITDPLNIAKMTTVAVAGKMTFIASSNEVVQYVAIDPTAVSAFPKPEIVGVVANQNLHALPPVDFVILTHPDFLAQAETLAQAHREKDNMTVEVVTTEQVYNEFSSGTPDATAYRWVMKMLYDRAIAANNTADMPKYLLLFGRGSFDNRKILSNSGNNLILTYQAENSLVTTLSYVTDDYFAFLDDNEGTQVIAHLLDIGVGRFPVTTQQQATDVVNKTISYMDNLGKGNWKNQLCFLADDGDASLHKIQADSIAISVGRSFPAYQVNKLYLDAYLQEVTASGERYPLAKSRFQNLLRTGLFLLDYTGHAGPAGWGNESILSVADVRSLSNKHLPVWVGATCDFLQFDGPVVSAGEHVVLNPNGGGIGILSAARTVYASQNLTLNKLFCDNLLKKRNNEHMRVGDVVAYAKNNVGTQANKLAYVYLGDPAIRLNYPTKYSVVTSKVNESPTLGNDTLRALSVATIQGYIADENGLKVTDFNGTLQAVVYDKIQKITMLNNHKDVKIMEFGIPPVPDATKTPDLNYLDRPNTLFSGKAVVTNGDYSFTFMLPKDIKYNYGGGRINYYAADDVNNYEAQGYYEKFVVGGTVRGFESETNGPDVQLFLNTDNFVSGAKVNETPLFVANVSDINGINTVGSGIGHDVMLTIDEDPSQSYILNEFFQSSANSFTQGTVSYKLSELANGKHTLTFRVWDLLNNSTTKTIDFEVVKGLAPVIFSVYNFPNPVKAETSIKVIHDRPETILKATVEIFDITGRMVWSFSQPSADNITWDLKASDGRRVNTGVYLYRVNIKTSESDISSKTNKMVIVEQ